MTIWQNKYFLPLIFAFVVGALSIAPHFLAVHALGNAYQGFPFIYQANEDVYMARIQDIVDGHPMAAAPLTYEYKDVWPTLMPTGEMLYALPSVLFHFPVAYTVVFYKFLLPAFLFLLIYITALELLEDGGALRRWSAIAAGLLITLGYDLADYAHVLQLLSGRLSQTTLSIWTRPVNPITGALLLFSLLYILIRILKKDTKRWFIPAGLALGTTIGYFFSWIIGNILTGLALLYTLARKEFAKSIQIGSILFLSILVQIPYWYYTLSQLGPAGKAIELKNGAYFTHAPILNKFLLAAIAIFLLCVAWEWYKKRSFKNLQSWWWLCGGILLACFIAYTEQVITGMTVWPYHFPQYTNPLAMLVVMVLGHNFLVPRVRRVWAALVALIVLISLWAGVATAYTYHFNLTDFATRQQYMPTFAWLNTNTPIDCVVLVDEPVEKLSLLIPAFTHCNTYMNTYGPTTVPDERIFHNMLVLLRLWNIQPGNVKTFLVAHPWVVNQYMYTTLDQALSPVLNDETQKNIAQIVPAYQSFYRSNFLAELKKYRIDYLLMVGTSTPPAIALSKQTQSGDLTLYKVQ